MSSVRDVETVCDADFRAVVVADRYLLKLLNSATIEWAQQTYNRSIWEPRPWPGE
ncbi:MAG: hypothetical protein ACQEXQ_16170 [Bacillota bacterium]